VGVCSSVCNPMVYPTSLFPDPTASLRTAVSVAAIEAASALPRTSVLVRTIPLMMGGLAEQLLKCDVVCARLAAFLY
jgi:hypothetical protein